jgi:hypothetical protein
MLARWLSGCISQAGISPPETSPAARPSPESLKIPSMKRRNFPKRDAQPTNFSTSFIDVGISVESSLHIAVRLVNLSVTQVLNLTRINFLAIPGIYSQAYSDTVQARYDFSTFKITEFA